MPSCLKPVPGTGFKERTPGADSVSTAVGWGENALSAALTPFQLEASGSRQTSASGPPPR
jgi:hypothetical protein